MSERSIKCEVKDKHVHPCWALAEVTDGNALAKGKGVAEIQLVNTETFKPSRRYYALRSGQHTKPGVAMNFCPFCGADIITDVKIKSDDDEDQPNTRGGE
jgi:hypothetical protein